MRLIIRFFAIIIILVTVAWLYSDKGFDTLVAFLTSIICYLYWEFSSSSSTTTKNNKEDELSFPELVPVGEFAYEVGTRMRLIREKLLHISKREMTEFLNLGSVNLLENYESGKEEYPLSLLKKIEDFFWINKRFVEVGGELSVNRRFNLCGNLFKKLIEEGYSPYILCCSDQRKDLFCYITMKRHCDGFIQVAIADLLCSFASNGGGRINIGNLIDAMIEKGVGSQKAQVLTASDFEWKALKHGYYFDHNRAPWGEGVDFECRKIFNEWYKEHKASFDEFEGYKNAALSRLSNGDTNDKVNL